MEFVHNNSAKELITIRRQANSRCKPSLHVERTVVVKKTRRCLLYQEMVFVWLIMMIPAFQAASAWASPTTITVDMGAYMDPPLVKKFGVFNSGIVPQSRYTPVILESLGAIKAASMRIDLSVGKFDAGFTQLMRPNTGGGQDTGVFNFNLIDTLADGLQAQRVPPYWGLSYNPATFQPECRGGFGSPTCAGSVSTCLGFENQSNIPGTNNYTCVPYGGSYWDDCWKCPPKFLSNNDYQAWADTIGLFHQHFYNRKISPIYEESWNEPDLTEYYNPTLSAYKGSSQDFIDAYEQTAAALLRVDQDATMGGNAVANQIRHNPAYPKQPNNEDSLKSAAAHGVPMDFFSFHSITTEAGVDQVKLIVDRMQTSREVLSSGDLLAITGPLNRFDTTEIHCNEFFPNSTTATLTTAFAASPHLATLLLESWKILLEETDLAQAHWAQYMDVMDNAEQIGLISYKGVPRPAWFAFRWYADLPVERSTVELNNPYVSALAGFSKRKCYGGVLIWNKPTPQNGQPSSLTDISITIKRIPLKRFRVDAFIIDDKKYPNNNFDYAPSWSAPQASAADGSYTWPPIQYNGMTEVITNHAGVKLPVNSTIYVRLSPIDTCPSVANAKNKLPSAKVLKVHHYYGMRPRKTSLYAFFQQRDWTAYLGMANEAKGFAIAGLTLQAYLRPQPSVLNISMNIVEGSIQPGGIAGVRVDLPIAPPGQGTSFPQVTSYFFYQRGTSPCVNSRAPRDLALDLSAGSTAPPQYLGAEVPSEASGGSYSYSSDNEISSITGRHLLQDRGYPCGNWENSYIQIPQQWGSKRPVWANRFIAVELSNFVVDLKALSSQYWEGRATVLFVLKDGMPGTKVQGYVTEQPHLL